VRTLNVFGLLYNIEPVENGAHCAFIFAHAIDVTAKASLERKKVHLVTLVDKLENRPKM
jgi:hypothetical protein